MPVKVDKNGRGIIIIDDFTGGLNTLMHPTLIADNQTPTASNVWASGGLLTKRPGNVFWKHLPLHALGLGMIFGQQDTNETSRWSIGSVTSSGDKGAILGIQTIVSADKEHLFLLQKTMAPGPGAFTVLVEQSNVILACPESLFDSGVVASFLPRMT